MKMIRARSVFNFREMIAHVNSNKELQDFTMVFVSLGHVSSWSSALSVAISVLLFNTARGQ